MDERDERSKELLAAEAAHGALVPREVFLAFLAGKPDHAPRTSDLYLACACIERIEAALVTFEAEHMPEAARSLRRMGLGSLEIDDVLGALREKLFFPEAGERSLLEGYSGRGELGRWLRAVAVRLAVRARNTGRNVPIGEEIERIPLPADNPELAYLKGTFAAAFRTALGEVLEALPPRDKTRVRQYFVDELTLDEIGKLHGVHEATASRWLAQARQDIFKSVMHRLMTTLNLREDELESLLRRARSQLDVSMRRLLSPRAAP